MRIPETADVVQIWSGGIEPVPPAPFDWGPILVAVVVIPIAGFIIWRKWY